MHNFVHDFYRGCYLLQYKAFQIILQRENYHFQVKSNLGNLLPQGSFQVNIEGLDNSYQPQSFKPDGSFTRQLPKGKFAFTVDSANYRPKSIEVDTRYQPKDKTISIILETIKSPTITNTQQTFAGTSNVSSYLIKKLNYKEAKL